MADLTVTIAETATNLQGGNSIADSTTYTIEGIVSYYQFKGQLVTGNSNHPIYYEHSIPIGAGGSKTTLAYLRITNLELSQNTMSLVISPSSGGTTYLNLAENESFIFCPKIGTSAQWYERSAGTTINASGYIESIYGFGGTFNGKHYEVFAAFID